MVIGKNIFAVPWSIGKHWTLTILNYVCTYYILYWQLYLEQGQPFLNQQKNIWIFLHRTYSLLWITKVYNSQCKYLFEGCFVLSDFPIEVLRHNIIYRVIWITPFYSQLCWLIIPHITAYVINNKNPAYGRHWISRPMRIIGPIFFFEGGMVKK